MNNLEWLYENDEAFAYGANKFVVDDGYSYCETIDQAHKWLLSEHETNGIDGETNVIAADSPLVEPCTFEGENVQGLPDENVSYLLRDVAKKSDGHTLYHGMTKLMQAIGKEPEDRRETGSELAVALNTLADMVERDYVSREAYEDLRDEFTWTNSFLHRMGKKCGTKDVPSLKAYVEQLEAERDEWRAKAEGFTKALEKMGCSVLANGMVFEPVIQVDTRAYSSKSAKRAAAVERLKDARYHTLADYVRAMLGWGHEPHFEDCRDALIDLLTDEPMDAQRDSNGTCPDDNETCPNQLKAHSTTASLSQQSVSLSDANDDFAPDSDVSANDVDANDANAALVEGSIGAVFVNGSQVFPPKLLKDANATCNNSGIFVTHATNKQISGFDARKSAEITENGTAKCEIRDFDADSREKLEADAQKFSQVYYTDHLLVYDKVIELLDRQAAITERECCKYIDGAGCDGPEVVHGLNGRIAELQQQVDNLQRKLEAVTQANDDYRAEYHRLSQERMNLARDLGNCMAERDQLREKYSKAIDHALAICNDFDLI